MIRQAFKTQQRRNEYRRNSLINGMKKTRWVLGILMLGVALGEVHSQPVIPSDRNFSWNPGMMSKGGIPNRTTVCATLSPSGGDDSAAIQAALDSCPSGQVVMLNAGTFTVNNYLLIHSSITLRGSGAGKTILSKDERRKASNERG